MRVAFTTAGADLAAPLEGRFGRAPAHLVYDPATGTFEVHDNRANLGAAGGVGVQSAQAVASLGVGAVVTGHCGPKAFRVLQAAGVKVYTCNEPTVARALERYRSGGLEEAGAADTESHWA